jgi:hypothetical protein
VGTRASVTHNSISRFQLYKYAMSRNSFNGLVPTSIKSLASKTEGIWQRQNLDFISVVSLSDSDKVQSKSEMPGFLK